MQDEQVYSVSDFVAVLNQTLEFAYPSVVIAGELANFRVSKNRWVYFDLKDEFSSVKFFGTVYQLPGPLEDGMLLQVRGNPRLHPLYGFSINIQNMRPVGEGSIKKAALLLEAKLAAEGLFEESRKRDLPYPPKKIGLIASKESAAYHDFVKIMNERWGGVDILLADVQVQGELAVGQIIGAIEYFNQQADPVDVLVITRGGGSPEDLAAFSTEQVVRAVAASRIPTLVAIGHEVDISLAELAADRRASTPSNAAQMLTPDRNAVLVQQESSRQQLSQLLSAYVTDGKQALTTGFQQLQEKVRIALRHQKQHLEGRTQLLSVLNPEAPLRRGYAIVLAEGKVVRSVKGLKVGDDVGVKFSDGTAETTVTGVK